jgi:hypothetical protein
VVGRRIEFQDHLESLSAAVAAWINASQSRQRISGNMCG